MQTPTVPIQVVEVENVQQHLNGGTQHHDELPVASEKPVTEKLQQSIVVAIASPPYSDGSSQTLPDDDGNV